MTTPDPKEGAGMNAPPKNNDTQSRWHGLGTYNHCKTKNQYFNRHRNVGQAEYYRRANLTAELEKHGFTLLPTPVGTFIINSHKEDRQ
jgi:hypothetical protein